MSASAPQQATPTTHAAYGRPSTVRVERQDHTKSLVTDTEIRCWNCKRLLIAKASRPWEIKCHRCRSQNSSPPLDTSSGINPPA